MNRIEQLYERYLRGKITEPEKEELFRLISDADDLHLQKLADRYLNQDTPADLSELRAHTGFLFEDIRERIDPSHQPRRTILWPQLAAVVAILLALSAAIIFFINQQNPEKNKETLIVKDLAPGGKRATLTLADGKTIILDGVLAGQLALVDGTRISKTANGQLIYENNALATGTVQINTVSIPRGGEYQLLLPDGTKIWLNAATTISYPTRFTGQQRRIKLSGEAYLEVAKDREHPFIVETDNQTVKVLGTHFNINTYQTDRIVTTLEEGSVLVSSLRGVAKNEAKQSVLLKPGEQAINASSLVVQSADLESALAWKNGLLFFKDAPLTTVLEEVARWYDVQVEYKTKPSEELFSGSVSRNANLSAILRILKITGVKASLVNEGKTRKLIIE